MRPGPARRIRGRGVWRQSWAAWRVRTPEEHYQAKEAFETVLTAEQMEVFHLHVVEGFPLAVVARMLNRRKRDVVMLWHEAGAALRDAA
jgi:hypothetical protein